MPPSLSDWLPGGPRAYCVSDLVDQLDWSAIEAGYEREARGPPPYPPRRMTKVLVDAYWVGVYSARRMEKRLGEDVAFRVWAAGNEPDFRTLADFRPLQLKAWQGLLEQGLRIAVEAKWVKLGRVALDGSKVRAKARKHQALSYGRRAEKEQPLREEVKKRLAEAEAGEAEEDARYGKNRRGDELPEELTRRERRSARIREAKRVVEERARGAAPAPGKASEGVKPEAQAQSNFTAPESRIRQGPEGFGPAYNAQVAVEAKTPMIVGQAVTQAVNDKQPVKPLGPVLEAQAGPKPQPWRAANGYCSAGHVK